MDLQRFLLGYLADKMGVGVLGRMMKVCDSASSHMKNGDKKFLPRRADNLCEAEETEPEFRKLLKWLAKKNLSREAR